MKLSLATGPHISSRQSTRRIMIDVLIALMPTAVAGVYLFGERAAIVLAVSVLSAALSELVWRSITRKPIGNPDFSAVVTGLILGLNLPSHAPWWIAAVGSAFAIIIVKEMFGGIGHNFMNPAMFARAVLLISWPRYLITFHLPQRLIGASSAATGDAITAATPLVTRNASIADLLFGNIPGTIGEVCKVAVLIGLVYMVFRRVIGPHIPVLFVGAVALLTWLYGNHDPLAAILSGGVLFGAVFMATDYVTNPMLPFGQYIFAVGCGLIVVLIREHGIYPEGVTYAILIMNIVTPLIDRFTKRRVYGEVKKHA